MQNYVYRCIYWDIYFNAIMKSSSSLIEGVLFVLLVVVLSVLLPGINYPLYNQSCKECEDTHLFVPTVLWRRNQSVKLIEGIIGDRL